jgi:hypothetical protein
VPETDLRASGRHVARPGHGTATAGCQQSPRWDAGRGYSRRVSPTRPPQAMAHPSSSSERKDCALTQALVRVLARDWDERPGGPFVS